MNRLKELVGRMGATTMPADSESINKLENALDFNLSDEYKKYLSEFGVIVYRSYETYGLGVPDDYYLNVLVIHKDLKNDKYYPLGVLPLMEIGDGSYYLYEMESEKILLWASPNGGVIKEVSRGLEAFLVDNIFE
ncbi:hypothetical protein A167_00037 [Alcanivorax sp. S71-1-4]|uniref:SMI1/KNR4 family protein n=1 Tax=Alcanivorax sp. S71-1-4 TaxID=1177159 RepID=UPI0013598ED3|nr:SMI1/KNR4 family protein [Alcanivorax sp. S71-1-4]KAF0811005.1 hypothetical protein A167_00037 [Alcanivorax sp. S71-1-4]